jgi:hypothetical protein
MNRCVDNGNVIFFSHILYGLEMVTMPGIIILTRMEWKSVDWVVMKVIINSNFIKNGVWNLYCTDC